MIKNFDGLERAIRNVLEGRTPDVDDKLEFKSMLEAIKLYNEIEGEIDNA